MGYLDTYYEEAFRHRADATTVINSALEARARHLGISAETILRLPNGADTENIQLVEPCTARAALKLPQEAVLLGYMGSLFHADAHLLIQAFTRVRAAQPGARLLLIGNPKTDIPLLEGMHKTGFVSYEELNLYLAACDVLLLPLSDNLANRGRWPSKIGDYFAAGRPTVACAVGDIQDILPETGAGLATRPDPDSFASGILRLLEDPALRERLGANGRRAAEAHYNWATLVDKVEALYQRLLQ